MCFLLFVAATASKVDQRSTQMEINLSFYYIMPINILFFCSSISKILQHKQLMGRLDFYDLHDTLYSTHISRQLAFG